MKFIAITAIWEKQPNAAAPLGFYMVPTQAQAHPLKAQTWKQADREVEKLVLTDGRKLWAYGEDHNVRKNCGIA